MTSEKVQERLMQLVKDCLEDALYELWDKLTPMERRMVFPKLISEFVEVTF